MLQFKIQIRGIIKPPVWRRVLVPETFSFHKFHEAIQAAFGWSDYHLYQFSPQGYGSEPRISLLSEDYLDSVVDAMGVQLKDIFTKKGQTYVYIYDFGDDWRHKITLEEITDAKSLNASCIGGKGTCPPEDCGGIWRYENMKVIFETEPESEEADELREWLGLEDNEIWDANEFNLEKVNEDVEGV
ncbi:MAG: plasmid pRiA4b ORF-3 family protein [Bacteroidales bacterium]|jgi:hypothetical protein|nr:plasmid pRiA4b ORF-3 family protein [Bacteroidales bacterium]